MPLAHKDQRLIYLAHPRKTAGNTLMDTLRRSGWRLNWVRTGQQKSHAIATQYQGSIATECRWKPQHYYLLTRHPEPRLSSLYRYFHKHGHIKQPTYEDFCVHYLKHPDAPTFDHGGGHYLSRLIDYIPVDQPWTELRYENGVDTLPPLIDPNLQHAGTHREPAPEPQPGQMNLTPGTRRQLLDWFAPDFDTFGYTPQEWA